mgnify:CR=1 FL=1
MLNQFSRTQLLLGQDGMERLFHARVAVFGIGGVGGYTVGTARKCTQRRQVPGSNAFVPAAVGLIVAGEVVKDLSAWGKPQ